MYVLVYFVYGLLLRCFGRTEFSGGLEQRTKPLGGVKMGRCVNEHITAQKLEAVPGKRPRTRGDQVHLHGTELR